MRCIIWQAPADCEHNSLEYGLPSYSSNSPCMRCKCNRSTVPWNDFTPSALWRSTCYTPAEAYETPLTKHWLLTIPGVNHWTFAYDFMHCADIGFSSSAVANMLYDLVFKHLEGSEPQKVAAVMELINQAYQSLGITDGKILRLSLSSSADAQAPHQHYPALMHSAIKAKQTARLVQVCAKLAKDYNDGSVYCEHRLHCFQNLAKLYIICDQAGLFFTRDEHGAYSKASARFLQHYSALSKLSFNHTTSRVGQFQWSETPKLHFQEHIASDSKFLNPASVWCYPEEHLVGSATKLASACLAGLPPWQVSSTICRKYQLGKHLQFLQMD